MSPPVWIASFSRSRPYGQIKTEDGKTFTLQAPLEVEVGRSGDEYVFRTSKISELVRFGLLEEE